MKKSLLLTLSAVVLFSVGQVQASPHHGNMQQMNQPRQEQFRREPMQQRNFAPTPMRNEMMNRRNFVGVNVNVGCFSFNLGI